MNRLVKTMKVEPGQEWLVQQWAKNCNISPDSEITDETLIAFRLMGIDYYDVVYEDEVSPAFEQAESDVS